ncbi:zinc finger and SCAN domain-containing protein 2 isoform X2 [Pygocentrus nattereri]|uniref:zinc finger and SCAN domain-containing protein 2 isoform X2 n=1 Tax=Pygocentrus nattereri TaxID=42514 RepID=UPI001890C957|nr:zinc finger and SCAN domain-containing protein 2 isoform X2 [Pygocentrus nattereri]
MAPSASQPRCQNGAWGSCARSRCASMRGSAARRRGVRAQWRRRWPWSSSSARSSFCLPLTEEPGGAAGENERAGPASRTMNGALYISFFQGQLESALEQVVQLAVQEITKSVGASLGSMLLDTASKEQENQRLRATLQGGDGKAKGAEEPGGAKEKQRGSSLRFQTTDSFRLEQKRRAVDQLKVVMEQVLEFAVCELTKIVEDSFDDLLLELTKTERENEELRERVRETEDKRVVDEEPQENRTDSPGSSEGAGAKEQGQEPAENKNGDESQLKSPSMLHRLLTLPSQLLEDNEESMEALSSLADPEEPLVITETPGQSSQALQQEKADDEEEEEEEEVEQHESSRNKGGKKVHVCKDCGKKFSRSNLLKIHRQTHKEKEAGIHCPECGKNFSQLTKLQAHLRTHSGKMT